MLNRAERMHSTSGSRALNHRAACSNWSVYTFAKSFLTSEWLYHSLKGKPNFDYTSVISGYAKAVEQLLYTLITRSVDVNGLHISLSRLVKDPPADISAQIKEETGKTNTFRYIPLTKDNIAGGYIDDSLWSLQTFINKNSWYLEVSGDSERMLYEMIDCLESRAEMSTFIKKTYIIGIQ